MRPSRNELPLPQVRKRKDLALVTRGEVSNGDGPAYYMFRDIARTEKDRNNLREQKIRYDITEIPPGFLNSEYIKTLGHYHPLSPDGVSYPEVYQVIKGEAHYLLQKHGLSDILLIPATEGDIVVIPPDYGHVTINPGDGYLCMANLVSDRFESDYGPFLQYHGAGYFEETGGIMVRNSNYPVLPDIRTLGRESLARHKRWIGSDLYDSIGKDGVYRFLNHPGEFLELMLGLIKDQT